MTTLLLPIIYISFISLGLPDGLLGAGWPSMYPELNVPISYAGIVSMIISVGTIISSLMSHRATRRFGTGKVTVVSVAATATALLGFSMSGSFLALCLWSIPYGFGAGSVDASLNNYVAVNLESRHMSWLHCFWGIGATAGPYIMGLMLTQGLSWKLGYGAVGILQAALTAALFLSLPHWKKQESIEHSKSGKALTLIEIFKLKGVKEVLICFCCYCAFENTTMVWAASYLNLAKSVDAQTAASYAGFFFMGMTAGRAICGFITMKFNDRQMIRMGSVLIAAGCLIMLLSASGSAALFGLILTGLGCAPIFPCIIHATPFYFGAENSQAVIGVQMASAYVGTCLAPPIFGFIAEHISASLMPVYILVLLGFMALMHELLIKKTAQNSVVL